MEKEENVNKKVEEKKEEPKFNKVSEKELKKAKDINMGKSKKDKKNKSDKKKEKGSKVGVLTGGIILLVLVLILVSVLILLPDTPEKSVEGMLNSFKNGDFTSVNKYVSYDDIANESEMLDEFKDNQELESLFFNKLSWKIMKIEKESDKATVEVEITNKDFVKVISNYTQEAIKIAFSGQTFTEEEQDNKLKEQLKSDDIGTKTVTTKIQLNKQDGKWKIQANDELVNALLPGLQEAVESLNSIINEE